MFLPCLTDLVAKQNCHLTALHCLHAPALSGCDNSQPFVSNADSQVTPTFPRSRQESVRCPGAVWFRVKGTYFQPVCGPQLLRAVSYTGQYVTLMERRNFSKYAYKRCMYIKQCPYDIRQIIIDSVFFFLNSILLVILVIKKAV